jgi:hypothetical protein
VGGELVGVGFPQSPVEAQMIKGLLESEGIPCLVQSLRGSRTVLVNDVHAEAARALLAEAEERAGAEVGEAESLPDLAGAESFGGSPGTTPQGFGSAGAGIRGWVLAFAVLGLAFGVFLLVHAI